MNKKVYISIIGIVIITISILSLILIFNKPQNDNNEKISEELRIIRETYDCRISNDKTYYIIYKLKTMTMLREELVIPLEVDNIPIKKIIDPDGGFMSFTNVRKIVISKNITYIGISDEDSSIGSNIFLNANSLSTIEVDKDNPVYSSENGILYNKDKTILLRYPRRKVSEEGTLQYTLNSNLIEIGNYAFSNNVALQTIIINENLKKINKYAFYNCTNLNTIRYHSNSQLEIIDDSAFASCKALTKADLPESLKELSSSVFSRCINLSSIYLPKGITKYGINVFTGCSELDIIKTPNDNIEYIQQIRNDLSIKSSTEIVASDVIE